MLYDYLHFRMCFPKSVKLYVKFEPKINFVNLKIEKKKHRFYLFEESIVKNIF